MVRSSYGRFILLFAVLAIVTVAACDKSGDKPVAKASGSAATGSQAAPSPAAGSPAAGSPAAGSPAAAPSPAAGNPATPPGPAVGTSAAAPSPAPPAIPPSEKTFKVGDAVDGQWTNGRWYPGRIGAVNADGTFRVNYNDGDVSKSLPSTKVRVRHATATHSSGAANACRGGLTQCGGRCVDIHNDNRNCNACGRQCPEACMGGSCVSNHYKYGN